MATMRLRVKVAERRGLCITRITSLNAEAYARRWKCDHRFGRKFRVGTCRVTLHTRMKNVIRRQRARAYGHCHACRRWLEVYRHYGEQDYFCWSCRKKT